MAGRDRGRTPARALRDRLQAGDHLISMGVWDPVSARLVERTGYDMVALQSFQYAASWGVPDVGVRTPSDTLRMAWRIAQQVELPILVDMEGGFGTPGHAAYWAREFLRAGVAAVHVDDEGPVHMCPWLPGSEANTLVAPAEHAAEVIAAMVEAVGDDLLVVARCQIRNIHGDDWREEELRRLELYVQAGASIVYGPKSAILADDMAALERACKRLKVPVLVQQNPPGFIRNYVPPDAADGRSFADRPYGDLFARGVQVVNTAQIYPVAYRAVWDRATALLDGMGRSGPPPDGGVQ